MEFKGTKGLKILSFNEFGFGLGVDNDNVKLSILGNDEEAKANARLMPKAHKMLEIIEELCENLSFQLDRIGVCGEGDGKGRKADADSYGGTELIQRAKQLIKEATEL